MPESPQQQIEELRETIDRHNRLYYVEAAPEVSDIDFDRLLKRLEQLEAEHPEFAVADSPTRKVGGQPITGFTTIQHRLPMLSIDNVYDQQSLRDFDTRLCKSLDVDQLEYTVEYKIDGVAVALIYERGRLTQALTRGDGRQGDDITHNARTLRGVPLRLHAEAVPEILEVRGEAFISNSDFARLNAQQQQSGNDPFSNPRNTTAGALKLLDPQLCAARKVRFLAHGLGYVEGTQYADYIAFLEAIRCMGMPVTPGTRSAQGITSAISYADQLVEGMHTLDFEVDGIVLKANRLADREALGRTSKSPRWLIAYKWERYEAVTRCQDITIQVGKTGALTPVAQLEPVEIAGTVVARASLHNRDELQRLGIRVGDWVVVEKAGKIIPHVVRVEEHRRDGSEQTFDFPEACPECGTDVVQDEGGVYVRCPNARCPAQIRETIRFFASRAAMDIEGLGIKLIAQLHAAGLLDSLAAIYRLHTHRETLLTMERLGQKSVDNLLQGIEASKQRPLWRLLTGLNIRNVGSSIARVLAERFGTVDQIAAQSEEHLAQVDEIGPIIAATVHTFFSSPAGTELVGELRNAGVHLGTPRPEEPEDNASAGIFAGKSLVVTGTLEHFKRDEIKELIRSHGGRAAGSVSSKTDIVVAGKSAGSKLAKAQQLGIPVLSEEALLAAVQSGQLPDALSDSLAAPSAADDATPDSQPPPAE